MALIRELDVAFIVASLRGKGGGEPHSLRGVEVEYLLPSGGVSARGSFKSMRENIECSFEYSGLKPDGDLFGRRCRLLKGSRLSLLVRLRRDSFAFP